MSEQQEISKSEEKRLVYYRLLLAEAGRFYEMHRIGQVKPFNIFSVLRSESDEVNLHSRFLHALLNYKKQKSKKRENLNSFLEHIGIKDFVLEGETVERERFNIDILIRNDKETAVAIENKIYAEDQDQQLQRYKTTLERHGYKNIHMVYLTLWGQDPSPESLGELEKKDIITVSYQNSAEPQKSIRPWLKDCQNRAFDNFELQVAIKQYRIIVQTLTGNSSMEAYMTDLLNLLKKDNNVQLSFDLQTALTEARPHFMYRLWKEIENELYKEIPDLEKTEKNTEDEHAFHPPSRENIEEICTKKSGDFGLYFRIGEHAWLGVEDQHYITIGVKCYKTDFEEEHMRYYTALHESGLSSEWWPVYQYEKKWMNFRNPTPEVIAMLLDDEQRQKFASQTAKQAKTLWNEINSANLVDFKK